MLIQHSFGISSVQILHIIAYNICIKPKEKGMSLLIEMPQFQQPPVEENAFQILLQQVTSLLHYPQFNVAVILTQESNSITLALPRGQLAFVRDTRWNLQLKNNQLKIMIHFYDCSGLNHLRAQSQRMKLQLMILLRAINSKIPIEQQFFVDPRNGELRYSFIISWKEYRQKLRGQDPLRKLFKYILSQLILYVQIVLFCEPQAQELQPGQPHHCVPHDLETINRYRFILKNTRKFRQSNINILQQVSELKNHLRRNPNDPNIKIQLDQLRVLFQSNIAAFQQMRIGLQQQTPRQVPLQKQLEKCIRHVFKNATGSQSKPPESNIVSGIQIIQKVDSKSLSTEGAHSQIMKGKFIFKVWKTINFEVINKNRAAWTDGKQNRAELIFKTCNIKEQSSINSFMNELHFLNQIRDFKSSYIAKYYLELKAFEQRNQKDYIYMRPYYHNLYMIVKKCKTLSFEERLSISYKISKGLCFLSSKGILHRDFKPHNIMVDQQLNPFIIDFGSCAPIYRQSNFKVRQDRLLTTPLFHIYYHEIPEQFAYVRNKLTREQYNRHPLFDVYSLGRVLCFIFFASLTPPNPEQLLTHPYPQLLKNILFIVTLCLQIDPDQRPTLGEIVSFLGTLKGYLSAITRNIEQKVRSHSQPKPTISTQN